jgi:hypothetical protein
MAMSVPEVGKIITGDAYRDAIHVCVAPVRAYGLILPGEKIGILPNGLAAPSDLFEKEEDIVGVADPFLKDTIRDGERFYVFLRPGVVEHLRHSWTAPHFKAKVPGAAND